jgi:hypothetical protein
MPKATLYGVKYELLKSSRRYYRNMKHSLQEPRIYEAEWDIAAAFKFKHDAFISHKPHIPQFWTEVSADSIIECLFSSEVPNQYSAEVAGAA